jgi:hypothetical protein
LNEFSSFIPDIAMLNRFRGPLITCLLTGFFLFLLISLISSTVGDPPASAEAQTDPECTGPAVCNVTVKASSRSPATRTSYEVTFTTPVEVKHLTGSIVMELHEDIAIPRAIIPALVRVRYQLGENSGSGIAADLSLSEQDDPRHPTTISIAHLVQGSAESGIPAEIPAGATVKITFPPSAGISNPTEGGAFSWKVGVGNGPLADAAHPDQVVIDAFRAASIDDANAGLLVDREIQLSHEEISRGQSVTVIARGYKNGHTLTVWRDANVNGDRESGESELCQVTVAGNDIGYCSFTAYSPLFAKGAGTCPDEKDADGNVIVIELDCNFINAVDGLSGSTVILGRGSEEIYEADQLLELVGRIDADTVQGPGGNIQVEVLDFPEGVITAVTIGGVPAEMDQLRIGKSGRLYFSVPVPDNVRLGRQYLQIAMYQTAGGCAGNQGARPECDFSDEVIVDISQPKAIVRIFPETALANQRVALSGLGFHDEAGTTIDEVKLGSFVLDPSRVNGGTGSIDIAGDGNWNGSVDLPIVAGTTTEGTHTLQVRDSLGRTGSAEVTVPPREVTATPIWGRPGTIVTVTGTGFPSRNDYGSSVNLRIYYDSGARYTAISAEPDVNGNFSQEIRIPLNTPTPSSNYVRVEFDDDDGITVVTSAPHEVPGAVLQLSPDSGPPGTTFTMTGTGFRHFIPVSSVTFGNIDLSPGATVSTDANGEFTVELLAPGLDTGQQTVRATVAGVTAGATFVIKPTGVVPGAPTPIAEALEDLGDRLLRVFHFNNDAKAWTFYAPMVADDSTLDLMVAGETYLVLVSETTQAILNGKSLSLTCYQGNCWNQIVW